jgi:hypothetical protein
MAKHFGTHMLRILVATLLALLAAPAPFAQAPPSDSVDVSMIALNATGPFVTPDFAKKLGVLLMQQRYPGVVSSESSPTLTDQGDIWWATFRVDKWPKDMVGLKPLLPGQLTLWIRKRDAAILAIH